MDDDAFGRQHAGRMPRGQVECERLAAQGQRVAFLDHHVSLRHARRRSAAPARTATHLPDHLPVFVGRDDACARGFLNLRRTADVIEMPVAQNDVFDALRIDADLPDVPDDMIDVGLLGRVEEDVAFRRRQQPDGDIARPDIVKIVEHLEGFDLLVLNVSGAGDPVGLAQRLRRGLAGREGRVFEIPAGENGRQDTWKRASCRVSNLSWSPPSGSLLKNAA